MPSGSTHLYVSAGAAAALDNAGYPKTALVPVTPVQTKPEPAATPTAPEAAAPESEGEPEGTEAEPVPEQN